MAGRDNSLPLKTLTGNTEGIEGLAGMLCVVLEGGGSRGLCP